MGHGGRLGGLGVALVVLAACSSAGGTSATTTSASVASQLRMNQVQVIGSHNSYHVEQPPEKLDGYLQV
ncbi:MAG: hypothetical protein ACXV8G_06380, partial [Acidimicrobiales bacterium]